MYTSLSSIEALLERSHTSAEIQQALADLKAMYQAGNITENQYKSFKKLLEDNL